MYKEPYIKPSAKYQEDIKSLNKQIEEERQKENADQHKIMRLEEQKLMQQLFSNDMFGSYTRFCSPW